MEQFVRVIETVYTLGGHPARVFVFCFPPAAMSRQDEVLLHMRYAALPGVEQFVCDKAGVHIYARDDADWVGTCRATWEVIDRVLQTGLKLEPGYPGSFFFVPVYGHWEGATTYAELLRNSRFVLPYMIETAA